MLKCKICEKSGIFEKFDEDVIKCKKCNSMYYTGSQNKEIPRVVSVTSNLKSSAQKKNSQLIARSYLQYLKKKANIDFENALDIGCGFGDFVEELNKIGINAGGIESDEDTVKNAKSHVSHGFFDELYDSTIKYDFISVNQTLYYFEDSFVILKKISDLLKPNGIVMIATVNTESSFRQEHKIWTQGCKICFGNEVWKSFDKFGLKCIDITSYDDNLFIDFFLNKSNMMSKSQFLKNLVFYVSKIKKLFVYKDNGINNFILLKKF